MPEIDMPAGETSEHTGPEHTGPVYTLTVIDTTQIQQYIFGSNRLAENVGASELVELATHQWVYEALPEPHNLPMTKGPGGGVDAVQYGPPDEARTIETDDPHLRVDAELVYAGGGNTVLLFRDRPMAVEFSRRLTRRVLLEAPGLELVIAHRQLKWEKDALSGVMQEMLGQRLARKKLDRTSSLPLLGLGVTAACRSTGLVAAEVVVHEQGTAQEERRIVAREIAAKWKAQAAARKRLESLLPRIVGGKWEIPADFDHLGRIRGEEGYLAVVHADGNGMGRRVAAIARRYPTAAHNRAYIGAMRRFSQAVADTSAEALRATADLLADALLADADLPWDQKHFPFRPIVFGGDDVTFVCNGRYGLALAARYLEAFEAATAQSEAFERRAASACAGVAVVKLHYPFARAYHLSEALCDETKGQVREWVHDELVKDDASALDWQFAISGITGSLEQIRRREYSAPRLGDAWLHARPLLLKETDATWRTWPVVEAIVKALVQPGGEWAGRRNKVKALREALRLGPDAVTEFLRTYRLLDEGLPCPLPVLADASATGWKDERADDAEEEDRGKVQRRCVYFDPIEIMDLYTDLQATTAPRAVVAGGGV